MATEKTLKTRLKMKHGKASEWALATKFTPLIGEIIVYDADETYTSPRFKVGDGLTNVNNLKFVNQDELAKITTLGDDLLAVKNGYLPKTGGTLSGNLVLSGASATIQKNSSVEKGFVINNTDNSAMVNLTMTASKRGIYSSPSSSSGYWVMSSPLDTDNWEFAGTASKSKVLSNLSLVSSSSTGTGYWNPYTWTITSAWVGYSGIFAITTNESHAFSGVFSVRVRASQIGVLDASELKWLSASSTPPELSLSIVETSGTSLVARLYIKVPGTYFSYILSKIQSQDIGTETTSVAIVSSITGTVKHTAKTVFLPSLSLGSALPIANGGTGSTTASGALSNLGGLAKTGGTMSGNLYIKNNSRTSQISFAPSFDPSYGGAIFYDAGGTNVYGGSTNFFIRQYSITNGATSSEGMGKFEQFSFPSTASGLTANASYMILTTKNPPTASQVGALPLTGGTLTGSLTVNNNIYSKGILVSQTDSYPGLTIQNASGANLAMLYSNGTTGGYSNAVLRVYSSASEYSSFTFAKDGQFTAPNDINSEGGLYAKGGIFSTTNSYPGIVIRDASYKQLAQFNANTANGGYSDAIIGVNSDAGWKYFVFGKNGTLTVRGSLSLGSPLTIANGGTGSTTASGALTNLGALPLTGGTLTGTLTATALYASNGNVVGAHLVTKTNNYPEVYFKNAAGTTLADFYVDTTSGGFADVRLKVFSDASTANYFTFGKNGYFYMPSGFSTVMGEFKNNVYPQLFFRNGSDNALAQLVVPTENGSYNGLAVKVFSNASTSVQYMFNSDGTFTAPFAVQAARTYARTNNYPELLFQNANGVTLAELYANTTTGAYAPIVLRVKQSVDGFSEFTFGRDGSFTAPAGITTTGNYITIKNNSYPQLTFSNANGADLGKVFVSTANGSYAGTKIRAYSSASSYYDFQFVGNGTFNCATLAPINALGIAYGGTGATTASGARTNLGITPANIGAAASSHTHSYLPLSGGTISGSLAVTGNITSNGKSVYTAGGNVIYSSTQPTGSTGMIWLKPV